MRFHCSTAQALTVALVNAVLVGGYVAVFLHGDPLLLRAALLVALSIVAAQTPLLCAMTGKTSRLAVLFISMCLFLFALGLISAWDTPVGSSPAGTWQARLDGGFRLLVLGQVIALPGLLLIAPFNLMLLKTDRRRT